MNKKWFIIEGNIGCGKSTLINHLSKNNEIETILEPVDVWQTIKTDEGKSLLDIFYSDPKRFSYVFQHVVFTTRMQSISKPQEKPIRISERSILTDKNIFMNSLVEMDMITEIEDKSYNVWYDWLKEHMFRKPDGIIYIRTPPDVCYDRIKMRGRDAESSISLDYLTMIHKKHEEWLMRETYDGVPIYVIDNLELDEIIKSTINIIKNKINSRLITRLFKKILNFFFRF